MGAYGLIRNFATFLQLSCPSPSSGLFQTLNLFVLVIAIQQHLNIKRLAGLFIARLMGLMARR
jgi:hypothetical protein